MKKTRILALVLAALLLLACIGCSASSKGAAYDTAASEPQYAMTEEAKYEMPAEEPAAAEAGSVTRGLFHLACIGFKFRYHLVLDHQRFDGLGSGDPLVVIARYARVHLAYCPVEGGQLVEGKGNEQCRDRNYRNYGKRELPVYLQHHKHRACDVGDIPYRVHEGP